jgi:hypothetical protein
MAPIAVMLPQFVGNMIKFEASKEKPKHVFVVTHPQIDGAAPLFKLTYSKVHMPKTLPSSSISLTHLCVIYDRQQGSWLSPSRDPKIRFI